MRGARLNLVVIQLDVWSYHMQGLFSWMSREKVDNGEQVSYKNEVR